MLNCRDGLAKRNLELVGPQIRNSIRVKDSPSLLAISIWVQKSPG
jgi:hypothetical protein